MNGSRIPTVNDLRVKLCYICREEEHFDAEPESPPQSWTHPCKCTLIAHEACLLKWIQTSQSDSRRATNALKCPQCGADYEIVSNKGPLLGWMGAANRLMQKVGRVFTIGSALGCAFIFGTGIYIVLTGYGAYAVRQFIGKEMYDILLTDDPANWPWTAYINLPSLTLSLILSRLQARSAAPHIPMLIPLLLVWPHAKPVGARSRIIDEYWQRPENARDLASTWPDSRLLSPFWSLRDASPSAKVVLDRWPPSPVVFGLFVVPLVRAVYKRCFGKVQAWVLGATPPSAIREGGAGWEWRLGEPFMIRIRMEEEVQGQVGQQQGQGQGEEQRVRVEINAEAGDQQQQGQERQDQQQQEQGPDEAAVAAAEQLIEVDTSSLGRRIGGALLIPSISSSMGSLLLRLSKRSHWLRRFLAVRPSGAGTVGEALRRVLPPALGQWSYEKSWEGLGLARQMGLGLRLVLGATWNGTRTWAEADPVWWRNAVGLGLFVVAKDCLQLLHLWLAKRELESRHVKSRDFAGVDIKALDLVPTFPRDL